MATDGAKAPGEEEEAVDDEWQHVQSPDSPPSFRLPPSSLSTTQWDTNDGVVAVVGGDDSVQLQQCRSSSVFPPHHPEGLEHLPPPPPHTPTSPPPSSSPSSPSASSSSPSSPNGTENEPPSPPLPSRPPAGILESGICGIASRVRHGLLLAGGFWSFGSAAAAAGVAAAVLLSLAYVRTQRRRWRWWRRDRIPMEASENHLLLLIRDKDQKISQLLLQIAQMNELIGARRRVQVLRVSG
ncbi:actin cytoskeleton-regulatory complex protein sla1 [Rhodamnia argentea]|uniref:Actin cytoskeleton-regulatory complex protein sla1 n=1 Tax=Rhodamnia argentea TaxID=178133 RepID=A0A8B8MYC8_9MYRT|nr:actin cytoskeleton-regulatory complex protein sla1 [Rhodamnia argentea]